MVSFSYKSPWFIYWRLWIVLVTVRESISTIFGTPGLYRFYYRCIVYVRIPEYVMVPGHPDLKALWYLRSQKKFCEGIWTLTFHCHHIFSISWRSFRMVSYIEENYATKVLTEKIRIFACFMSEFISRRRKEETTLAHFIFKTLNKMVYMWDFLANKHSPDHFHNQMCRRIYLLNHWHFSWRIRSNFYSH